MPKNNPVISSHRTPLACAKGFHTASPNLRVPLTTPFPCAAYTLGEGLTCCVCAEAGEGLPWVARSNSIFDAMRTPIPNLRPSVFGSIDKSLAAGLIPVALRVHL